MIRETNNKPFVNLFEEIWEEIEIQFYGIIGAIIFFILVYLFFHPPWMRPMIEFLFNIKSAVSAIFK